MRKSIFRPKRKRSTLSKDSQGKPKPLLTMQFSTMLRKIKAKKKEQLRIKTEEDNEEYEKKN